MPVQPQAPEEWVSVLLMHLMDEVLGCLCCLCTLCASSWGAHAPLGELLECLCSNVHPVGELLGYLCA